MSRVRCLIATGPGAARPDEAAIAVDVLRASTTITVALERGAAAVIPVREVDAAFALARQRPGALLMGERGNAIVPGFQLGNSPVALLDADLAGRTIVFTSTNFPRAVEAAAAARSVLVGCLANLSAVVGAAAAAARRDDLDICIALAGNLETTDDEDLAFAGACGGLLAAAGFEPDESMRPAMDAAARAGADRMVLEAPHAAALIRQGYGDDVRFAARADGCAAVGVVRGGAIVPLGGAGAGLPA